MLIISFDKGKGIELINYYNIFRLLIMKIYVIVQHRSSQLLIIIIWGCETFLYKFVLFSMAYVCDIWTVRIHKSFVDNYS